MDKLAKIDKLTDLLCQWNKKEWRGREDELVYEIWVLFETECLKKWNR